MEEKQYINEAQIRSQAWKFYFGAAAWPVYLFILPYIFLKYGAWSILFMIFPGVYIFTWIGYLMHETWHKYTPNIPNNFLYTVLSWELLTDPQIYRLLHGYHHSQVHTWEDTEFHPLGYIANPVLRAIYNFFEIFTGIAFVSVIANFIASRHPRYAAKYRASSAILSFFMIIAGLLLIGIASHAVFGINASQIVLAYVITIWINSFALHHSQMVEHGNLIVEGSWNQRNIWTRNIRDTALAEKIFLFLTHGDSREHVLHHTLTSVYSRPFPHQVPMPSDSIYINLRDYAGIMIRMLKGQVDTYKAQ